MLGDAREVRVRGQQAKLVTDAELRQDRVDGAYLEAAAARPIPELRGLEVVVAIGSQEGEGAEPRDDGLLVARAAEALEELLVDEAGGDEELAVRERSFQGADLGRRGGGIAAKREGPDARVHEERQARERSRL